jgi:hypothetical protein
MLGNLIACTVSQCLTTCQDLESCLACNREKCTPTFVQCSGLENPVGAIARQTEEDLKIWTSGGSAKFGAVDFAFGGKCRDDAACASSCLNSQAGYSEACGKFMGDLIACTVSQCLSTCQDLGSCIWALQRS